jgi:hypothetical protein
MSILVVTLKCRDADVPCAHAFGGDGRPCVFVAPIKLRQTTPPVCLAWRSVQGCPARANCGLCRYQRGELQSMPRVPHDRGREAAGRHSKEARRRSFTSWLRPSTARAVEGTATRNASGQVG